MRWENILPIADIKQILCEKNSSENDQNLSLNSELKIYSVLQVTHLGWNNKILNDKHSSPSHLLMARVDANHPVLLSR